MQLASLDCVLYYGFGEAGRAFATGIGQALTGRMIAYDIKAGDPREKLSFIDAAAHLGVACESDRSAALRGACLVFCLVTADQSLSASHAAAAAGLPKGAFWLDGNSCSPGTKRQSADVIENAGGRYVDMAIMAPVFPAMHRTPVLLSGPHAAVVEELLIPLDMHIQVVGDHVGDASMIKMLRSIVIKGREALTAECLLAARRAGVERQVISSLQASDNERDWVRSCAYNLERMMVHGRRRAAEMREVAATLRELGGLPDRMAVATAEWEEQIGSLGLAGGDDILSDRTDRILAKLG